MRLLNVVQGLKEPLLSEDVASFVVQGRRPSARLYMAPRMGAKRGSRCGMSD